MSKIFIKTDENKLITERWICDKNPNPEDNAIIELQGVDPQAKILGMKYNGKGKALTGETVEVEVLDVTLKEVLEEVKTLKSMVSTQELSKATI